MLRRQIGATISQTGFLRHANARRTAFAHPRIFTCHRGGCMLRVLSLVALRSGSCGGAVGAVQRRLGSRNDQPGPAWPCKFDGIAALIPAVFRSSRPRTSLSSRLEMNWAWLAVDFPRSFHSRQSLATNSAQFKWFVNGSSAACPEQPLLICCVTFLHLLV
jgi:hypothetical protein